MAIPRIAAKSRQGKVPPGFARNCATTPLCFDVFESPKLQVTGYIKDDATFAAALERALLRSNAAMKVIDLKRIDDAD
jgi:hypothetical protein